MNGTANSGFVGRIHLKTKLVGGFGLLTLLLLAVGFYSFERLGNLSAAADRILVQTVPHLTRTLELEGAIEDKIAASRVYLLTGDRRELDAVTEGQREAEDALRRLARLVESDAARDFLGNVGALNRSLDEVIDRAIQLRRQGRVAEAAAVLMEEGQPLREALRQAVGGRVGQEHDEMQRERDQVLALAAATRRYILVLCILALVLAVLLCVFFPPMVARPVRAIAETARRVAGGDLTVPELPVRSQDEIGQMSGAFNKMVRDLRAMMGDISAVSQRVTASSRAMAAAADRVATATAHISTAVQRVARGAGEQSAGAAEMVQVVEQLRQAIDQIAAGAESQSESVTRTAGIVAQMAQAIDEVARMAQDVSEAAREALVAADEGGEAVRSTVAGMARIRETALAAAARVRELGERSQQIGEIVQVISGIAEQTNLLALNAAIEAARAGEHGKGFAVVAEEVRKLAERSGRATKEIAELISTIQRGVEAAVEAMDAGTREVEVGTELAGGVGRALENILGAMRRTNEQAQGISAAAEELAANATEVVKAMDGVAAVTEENTAATEEMAASSDQVFKTVRGVADVAQQTAAAVHEVSSSREEVNASAEEISGSARGLAGLAQELQGLVSRFRL